MKIKKILTQYRRDFRAVFVCEHCGDEVELSGYDDSFFHQNVIPEWKCDKCGKKSPSDYRGLTPKYWDSANV